MRKMCRPKFVHINYRVLIKYIGTYMRHRFVVIGFEFYFENSSQSSTNSSSRLCERNTLPIIGSSVHNNIIALLYT